MTNSHEVNDRSLERYIPQIRYPGLGAEGQRRLLASCALVCGCGGLGSVLANTLARAGVGRLRIVDRDFLEIDNLHRQVLYDEQDVASGLPKAVAAEARLRKINSQIEIEAIAASVDHTTIGRLLEDVDVILDGTDNFETRFLLNDAAVKFGVPWVYGGCVATEGQTMTILPGETPCLRCLLQDVPPAGSTATSHSAGILAPIVNIIGSLEACEAIKILSGHREAVSRSLQVFELWDNRVRQVNLASLRETVNCPTCRQSDFPWLEGRRGSFRRNETC